MAKAKRTLAALMIILLLLPAGCAERTAAGSTETKKNVNLNDPLGQH